MLSAIIYYVMIGVAYNFLWDVITTRIGNEEYRFTMLERVVVTCIWPLATAFAIYSFIRAFLGSDNK